MRPGSLPINSFAFVLVACLGGCMSDGNSPRVVSTFAELKAADGQVVRVKGKVQYEKLGDTVLVEEGLDVLCPDLRLPDDVTEATLEGRLELWEPPVAETSATGEISQGVEEATRRWVLRGCKRI